MEVEHFSHPDHPLMLIDQVLEYIGEHVFCSGCEESISGPCYSCYSNCFFFLHKRCAELPTEIQRFRHPLILLAEPPPDYEGSCVCDLCGKTCESFVYHCSICKFDLDINCAFPPCFFKVDSQIHQFFHIDDHPLTLNEEQEQENHGEGLVCSACKEQVLSGPNYNCKACKLFLHKKCAELPQKINLHLHPEHPLFLLKGAPAISVKGSVCDFCDISCIECFVYHCFLCDFKLHIQCALPPCIYEDDQNQGHQFRGLKNSFPFKSLFFTCNACGAKGDERPFMCTTCQLVVHKKCISLPQTIDIRQHPGHSLTHTYFPQEDDVSGKPYCGVCQIQFKSGHGGYQCKDCSFSAHVNCALNYTVDFSGTRSITSYKESMDSSIPTAEGALEIEHFSHMHSLILMNEFKDNINCEGCLLPIFSNPYYGCSQCNFFLHKACSELPRNIELEGVLLTLLSRADTADGIFCCYLCDQFCHGFVYESTDVTYWGLQCDVRCGIIASSGTIKHEGHHDHQLFYCQKGVEIRCRACSEESSWRIFRCDICDFSLDFRCATLPREARHEYHEHPLFLTYIDPNDYQFYCDICERERDPKLWFYRCEIEKCCFDAHPECVLGKHPYIKLGGSYTYNIHPHPLRFVEKTELDHHPACHTCGASCGDLALECTDSGCNFIIHRIGRCRLEGKVAIVTGGSRGIGEATVRLFVRHGAKVVIADIEDANGVALADSLSPSAIYIHCDVSLELEVENLINLTVSQYGRLDILFNNVGVLGNQSKHKSIVNFDADEFDNIMRVNVRGAALGMKHAARVMVPQQSGCIISTASVAGLMGGLGHHGYTALKHALVGLTKNTACELGRYGIRVNCISPFGEEDGADDQKCMDFRGPSEEEMEKMEELVRGLGNLKGATLKAKDIAEAALYLASDESKYVSGHNLVVDGGFTTSKNCVGL